MREYIEIQGGSRLVGEVTASGAKNAALPQLMATLLTGEECVFTNVPNLEDIHLTVSLLETFGAEIVYEQGSIRVKTPRLLASEASYSLVKALRASFWVLGPLLARGRAARVALPGGDIIGARPVDMHLQALTQMGADIKVKHGVVYASAPDGLKPAKIVLRFASVGATHQILMAAALTKGITTIEGAAREPEVVALADMLTRMGAKVSGAGTSTIEIEGTEYLSGVNVHLIGDRIEAGTYLLAGAATGGDVTVRGIEPQFFGKFLDILSDMGLSVSSGPSWVRIVAHGRLKPVHVSTAPYPEFATDLQAPLMAALSVADGESTIEEHVFEGRFGNVSELCRMGANISVNERTATIHGVLRLSSAEVEGMDIRAAASLVIASLQAEGTTLIHEIHHLRRGYSFLERKLQGLGARVSSRIADAEDYVFTGC